MSSVSRVYAVRTSSGSLEFRASVKLMFPGAVSVASVVEASVFAVTIPMGSEGIAGVVVCVWRELLGLA